MSFDLDKKQFILAGNEIKSMTCQADSCHWHAGEKPQCTHSHVEHDDKGNCIFYDQATIKD